MTRLVNSNIKLFIVCSILVVLLSGCNNDGKSKDTGHQNLEANSKPGYANDMERLQILTDRINNSIFGNYVVVFGNTVGQQSNMLGVEYSLFDRLDDAGVAVMIAEAILSKRFESEKKPLTTDRTQMDASLDENTICQIDLLAGKAVAKAGFGSEGFSKWLLAGSSQNIPGNFKVPANIREANFMKGYLSVTGKDK